jgi:hypothetical protein
MAKRPVRKSTPTPRLAKQPSGAGRRTSLSSGGGAMQSNPILTPGDTASRAPTGPQNLQGSRANAAIPPPPGQAPSRYNEAAGAPTPNSIADVDLNQNIWSPFQPVAPFGPPYVNYPRTFDYPVGINLDFTSAGRLSFFKMLQVMSRTWGILRTVIETRKDQLMRIPWDVQVISKPKDKDNPRLKELRAFFRRPDRQNNFNIWSRMQLEDRFVIDAANYYVWRDRGGKPYSLMHLAGETIKPLVDDAGRRPEWPNPAFQQLIKGLPWENLNSHDFVYVPMRPTPQEPTYGYSEVQMIYIEILQGIKKMLYKLSYWDEGNIPQLIMTVPAGWTPDQVAAFQAHLDVTLAGNVGVKSRIRLMPSDSKPFDIKNANGELLKTDEDEWVTRLVCYAFSVSPQPFVRQMNRATAESAQDAAAEEGLHPTMTWFKESLMDPVIQDPDIGFGYDDCEFVWLPEPEVDTAKQMVVITGYTKVGLMTPDEGRDALNLPPLADGAGAKALVMTPNGPVPLAETIEANRQKALAVPDQLGNAQEAHDQRMSNFSAPPGGPGGAPVGGPTPPRPPPQGQPAGAGSKPNGKGSASSNGGVGKVSRAPFLAGRGVRPVEGTGRGRGYGWDALEGAAPD